MTISNQLIPFSREHRGALLEAALREKCAVKRKQVTRWVFSPARRQELFSVCTDDDSPQGLISLRRLRAVGCVDYWMPDAESNLPVLSRVARLVIEYARDKRVRDLFAGMSSEGDENPEALWLGVGFSFFYETMDVGTLFGLRGQLLHLELTES